VADCEDEYFLAYCTTELLSTTVRVAILLQAYCTTGTGTTGTVLPGESGKKAI
jgi:hypothetical protein